MQSSCALILGRVAIPIALAIFVISRVWNQKIPNVLTTNAYNDDTRRQNEWATIEKLLWVILVLEILWVIGFTYFVSRQPTEFIRITRNEGVLTEMNAQN